MEDKKKQPFYKNKWFIFAVAVIFIALILRGSDDESLKVKMEDLQEENNNLIIENDKLLKEIEEKDIELHKQDENISKDTNLKDLENEINELKKNIEEKDFEIEKLKENNQDTVKEEPKPKVKKDKIEAKPKVKASKATKTQEQAIKMAEQYLSSMPFSKSGLIEQLKFEGFSSNDAKYALDNISVDWQKQANKMAEQYLDSMPFSRSGLIDQLKFEGFSQEQANKAAKKAGL